MDAAALQNLSGILQQSVAQLSSRSSQQAPAQDNNQAVAALTTLVTGLVGALTQSVAANAQQPPQQAVQDDLDGPIPSIEDFVANNGLEPWCAEALRLLSPDQQARVMSKPLNIAGTMNLNGVFTSRIKEVADVRQRLDMFIQLNGLGEGVVDRLNTLTVDQHEKVMESTLKIQKANNPSGVAMRRITDVLKSDRLGTSHGQPRTVYAPEARPPEDTSNALSTLVQSLIGSQNQNAGTSRDSHRRHRDRSRSRGRGGGYGSSGGSSGRSSRMASDIEDFLRDYRCEWWLGEVLTRLSLYQRQNVMQDLANMSGVRNPSGVVMARVKAVASTQELLCIFIDLNGLDQHVSDELWTLAEEHQQAVMAPGIYVQNARSPSVAVRSRIKNVLAGNDAMGGDRIYSRQ